MSRTGYSQKRDVLFMRLVDDFPAELRNALVDAGLGDPCILEDCPRMTAEEIYKRGVAIQESHKHVTGTIATSGIAATPISIDGTVSSVLWHQADCIWVAPTTINPS